MCSRQAERYSWLRFTSLSCCHWRLLCFITAQCGAVLKGLEDAKARGKKGEDLQVLLSPLQLQHHEHLRLRAQYRDHRSGDVCPSTSSMYAGSGQGAGQNPPLRTGQGGLRTQRCCQPLDPAPGILPHRGPAALAPAAGVRPVPVPLQGRAAHPAGAASYILRPKA